MFLDFDNRRFFNFTHLHLFRSSLRSIQVSPNVTRREFPVNDDVSEHRDSLKDERKPKDRKKSENSLLMGKDYGVYLKILSETFFMM